MFFFFSYITPFLPTLVRSLQLRSLNEISYYSTKLNNKNYIVDTWINYLDESLSFLVLHFSLSRIYVTEKERKSRSNKFNRTIDFEELILVILNYKTRCRSYFADSYIHFIHFIRVRVMHLWHKSKLGFQVVEFCF